MSQSKWGLFALAAIALIGFAAAAYQRPITLVNAAIYRERGVLETESAMVLRRDMIEFMGSDAEAIRKSAWHAKILDVRGRLVLPGFIDAHVHPLFGAMMDAACPLDEVESQQELRDTLNACRAEEPAELLLGFGLNQSRVALDATLFGWTAYLGLTPSSAISRHGCEAPITESVQNIFSAT